MIRGMLEVRLDRHQHNIAYGLQLIARDGSEFSIAQMADLKFEAPEPGAGYLMKQENHFLDVSEEALRTLYLSFQKEMIRIGLIPKPLVEDEVEQLREQLKDTQKTRDQLIGILEKIGNTTMLANIRTVTFDPSQKVDPY